ncbi:hypothetical protein AAA088_15075, partial [Hominifimenecus microfluidus]
MKQIYFVHYLAQINKNIKNRGNLPFHDFLNNKCLCEPHMTKVTCFSAALSGKTKYRRIRL